VSAALIQVPKRFKLVTELNHSSFYASNTHKYMSKKGSQ